MIILIMAILITLNTGDITYNDITHNITYMFLSILKVKSVISKVILSIVLVLPKSNRLAYYSKVLISDNFIMLTVS
jgi:hypothetical protein